MSDIFNEVDEEVRREKLKRLWDRYQVFIVGGAILIVLLVGGWRLNQWWESKQAAEAGGAFQAAMTLSAEGKHAEAEAAFAKVAEKGAAGYRDLARLQAAAELAQRDPKAAVEAYDALAVDSRLSETMRDLAAVRAGYLLVDSAPYEELRRRLEPATGPERSFRNSAREILALSALRANDVAAARKWFEQIVTDVAAPAGLRQRIEMLMALAPETGNS
ncbi:MAG TPA: tetratricopeptide repeat protein [Xanthobacteraceae bacterium]|nr:tetratricopeptide repeat protein [Xanthobacteraceae bacterium]